MRVAALGRQEPYPAKAAPEAPEPAAPEMAASGVPRRFCHAAPGAVPLAACCRWRRWLRQCTARAGAATSSRRWPQSPCCRNARCSCALWRRPNAAQRCPRRQRRRCRPRNRRRLRLPPATEAATAPRSCCRLCCPVGRPTWKPRAQPPPQAAEPAAPLAAHSPAACPGSPKRGCARGCRRRPGPRPRLPVPSSAPSLHEAGAGCAQCSR